MFSKEQFKRKLEEWLQNNPTCTQDEIRNCYQVILSDEEYLNNKAVVDECINWYAVMHQEKKVEGQWYHTIDLGDGEITNGIYDHRTVLKHYRFPESLKGKKVLDVGCADGFFSFEFWRRGADKVVGLDAYKSDFFILAKEKLNSNVEYYLMDVYDLSPTKVGYFDFVFCGSLLIHLSDPFKALVNIRSVIKKGEFILCTPIYNNPLLHFFRIFRRKIAFALLIPGQQPGKGNVSAYWLPTADCVVEMMYKSGFDKVEKQGTFILKGYNKSARRKEIFPHVVVRAIVE